MNSSEIALYIFMGVVLLYVIKRIYDNAMIDRVRMKRRTGRKSMKRECPNCGNCQYGLRCGGKCPVCRNCPYGNSCPSSRMIEGFADVSFDNISNEMNKNCTVCQSDTDADTFLRERLLTGRGECETQKKYSKKELDNYRDRHFAFRNKIWQTSKDVDMVDKINDMYLSGSYDLSRNKKGTRIADLFDGLTKDEDHTFHKCPMDYTGDKDIQRIADQTGYLEQGHNGKMIQEVNWKYSNEKDMNGGAFFNEITGFDGNSSPAQAL